MRDLKLFYNIDKFDRDFRFQLNKEEYDIVLKCNNFTSSWGGNRKLIEISSSLVNKKMITGNEFRKMLNSD